MTPKRCERDKSREKNKNNRKYNVNKEKYYKILILTKIMVLMINIFKIILI